MADLFSTVDEKGGSVNTISTIENDAKSNTFVDDSGFKSGVETKLPPQEIGPAGIGTPNILDESSKINLDDIEVFQQKAIERAGDVSENDLTEDPVAISELFGSKAFRDQSNPFKKIDALNVITNQGREWLREASINTEDYDSSVRDYDKGYVTGRKQIVQDGVKRLVVGSKDGEGLVKALNSADPSQLTEEGLREYQAAVNLNQYGNKISKPLGTFAFTSHGMQEINSLGKNDAVIDGGAHIARGIDGGWEADIQLPGLSQDKRKMVLNPDIPTQTAITKKNIAQLESEKKIAEEDAVKQKSISKLDSEYGWVQASKAENSVKSIQDKIDEQKERMKWLTGDKDTAESYLAIEEVASKIKQDDDYMSKIGKGWLNPIAIGSQAVGGIVEGFAFTGEVGALAIGGTLDFLGAEKTGAKITSVAGDIRSAKEDITGLEGVLIGGFNFGTGLGVTKAQFRGTGADKFGLALTNEIPQLGIAAITCQLPVWMGKGAIRQISKNALKKVIKEGGKKVTKKTLTSEMIMNRMIENGSDKFQQVAARTISPATAALYGAGREGGGAWEQTMDFANNQLGNHKNIEALRNEQLIQEDLGNSDLASDLKKRGDAYDRAINNVGAQMVTTMAAVGVTEFLPFLRLFKAGNRTGQQVFDSFVNLNIKQSNKLREAIAFSVDALVEKGGMEGLQEALANGSTKFFIDPDQNLMEGVPEAIQVGIVLGVAGNYASRRYSQELSKAGVEGLVRGDIRQKELKGLAGGLVFENKDTGKFFVNDRVDKNEEFNTFEEAAMFVPARHGMRFQKFASEALVERGHSPEEAAALVVGVDTLVSSVAKASGRTINDTYSLLNGEDILDQLPEPDLQTPEVLGKVKLAEIGAPRSEFETDQKRRKGIEKAFKKRAKSADKKVGKQKPLTPVEKKRIENKSAENPNNDLSADNSVDGQARINANKTRAVLSQMSYLNRIIDNENLSDEVRQKAQQDFEALFDSESGPGKDVLQKIDEFGEFFDRVGDPLSSDRNLPTPDADNPVPIEPTKDDIASIESSLEESFNGAENAFAKRSEQAKTFIQDEADLRRFDDITRFLETGKLTDEQTSAMVAEQQDILDRNDLRPFETITSELGKLDAQLEKLENQDQTDEVKKKIAENQETQRGLRRSERQLFADEKSLKRAKDAKRRVKEREKSGRPLEQPGLDGRRKRGETEIITDEVTKEQKAIIRVFKEGDVSTFMHEVTHALHQIKNEDGISLLSLAIGTDQTAEQFWNWATFNGQLSQDSRDASERISSGIEQYLAEGVAPERGLDAVFRILSNAIRNVYANMINSSGVKLNKSARRGYDRLFAQSQETFFDSTTGKATQGGFSILGNPEIRNQEAIPESEIPPDGTPLTMSNQPITTDSSGKPIGVTPTDPRTLVSGVGIRYDRKTDKLRKKSKLEQALRAILRPADSQERGIIPTEATRILSESQGLQESIIFELEVLVKDTRIALNKEYGTGINNRATKDKRKKTERAINTYMVERDPKNESTLLELMLPNTRAMAIRMKASITKLSNELIRAGVVDGNLAAIIQENVGAYLHRSYEIFENPDWSTRLLSGLDPSTGVKLNDNEWSIVNAAKAFFRAEFNAETELEQDQLVQYFLNPENQTGGIVNSLDKSGLSRKNRSILKKRSDIAPEIQALWGVYDDPLINYSKTVLKMANLIATHNNLTGLKKQGLENGWISHPDDKGRDPRINHEIVSEGNKALEPLDGFYTTQELAEALFAGFSQQGISNQNQIASTYLALQRFNGAAKFSAIVLNPGTIARNYIGGMVMYYGNGYADPISMWKNMMGADAFVDSPVIKGHRVGAKEFSRKGASDPITAVVSELIGLQVIDTNVVVSEFREVMGLVGESRTSEEFSEKLFGRAAQIAKGSVKRAGDFYRMGDSVWKAAAYFSELEMQIKANKDNVPLADLKRRAADRATDLMPSYSKAPDWVKNLSKNAFYGLFVTFTAESIRITSNQMKIGIKDLGTPEMRAMGAKRIGGLLVSRGGGIKAIAHFLSGVSQFYDQDEDDIRKIGPNWFRVSDLVNFGENEKGQKLIGILDFVDPFAQLHNVASAIKSVNKDNAFNVDLDAGLIGVGNEIFGPFLRPEIGTKAAIDTVVNFDSTNVPQSIVRAVTKDIFGAINPKGIPRTWRTFSGDTGDVPPEVALRGFLMGVTPMALDAEKSLSFAAGRVNAALASSQKNFAENLKLPAGSTDQGVAMSMSLALAGRKAAFAKMTEQTYASIRQGMSEATALEILQKRMTDDNAVHVLNGTVPSIHLRRFDAVKIEKDRPGFINRLFQDGEIFVKERGKIIDPSLIEQEARGE